MEHIRSVSAHIFIHVCKTHRLYIHVYGFDAISLITTPSLEGAETCMCSVCVQVLHSNLAMVKRTPPLLALLRELDGTEAPLSY